MHKILRFLNIPRHIKKVVLKLKINRSRNKITEGPFFLRIINTLIILILFSGLVYINYLYRERTIWLGIGSIIGLVIIFVIFLIYRRNKTNDYDNVSKLILKDDDGRITDEWEIANNVACLIGKKTRSNEVNIDLSNAVYASLISREHGVINKAGEKWYFEDIGSSNGSGIKRRGESQKFKVEEGRPYEIGSGDVLYIANTKLYVR